MQKNNIAIILSGGTGSRFKSKVAKQFFKIDENTIIEMSVYKFINSNKFNKVIIVSHKSYIKKTKKLFHKNKTIVVIEGGTSRQSSVFNGLKIAKKFNAKYIFIHDAVRPFFSEELIDSILDKLSENDGVIPAINIYDSIREVKRSSYINVSRKNLKVIQTPQGFRFSSIFNAHKIKKNLEYTDDSMILYESIKKIEIIDGQNFNFKITTKNDLEFGKIFIKGKKKMNNIRVGTGFDVHKFKEGKYLILFGIKIPFNKSLDGHSDADVGFHAIVDSILGALCLGDIGNHFPPTNDKWRNKPSIYFMKFAEKLLLKNHYKINNLDITLICEEPRVSKYQTLFIGSISKALKIEKDIINVKGTTTEKLGFIGRKEGIACQVSVTLSDNEIG